jgi:hypothetical protein
VQKRAYKILAYLCSRRRDFVAPNLRDVLETLLAGVGSSLSAAKRYRLACLQSVVLLLLVSQDAASLDLGLSQEEGQEDTPMSPEEERRQAGPLLSCFF